MSDSERCPDWPDAPQFHARYCPPWHTKPNHGKPVDVVFPKDKTPETQEGVEK